MKARYFRYLFENQNDGLYHSGSIYDRLEEKITNYIYMVGNYAPTMPYQSKAKWKEEADAIPENVDILTVGGYSAAYIEKLISIVSRRKVDTIILPYLTPVQRLLLTIEINGNKLIGRECIHFLQDPYQYLNELCIPNIYFLYGNGEVTSKSPEEWAEGSHFDLADAETLRLVKEMEGYYIPIVKAGYLTTNGWLFHFGCYGMNLKVLSNFTKEYFGHLENIYKFSDQENEDYMWQIKKLVKDYRKKFSNAAVSTVAMFEGPLDCASADNDSFMVQKEFTSKEYCKPWLSTMVEGKCNCEFRCIHNKDYDTMQSHKNKERKDTRFGMLLLGNTNLNRYLPEVVTRFWGLRERIRAIAVPNSGTVTDWNIQVLGFSSDQDRMYWLCGKQGFTSPEVIRDITLSTPCNRFVNLTESTGCCFSGYLIPRDNMEYL